MPNTIYIYCFTVAPRTGAPVENFDMASCTPLKVTAEVYSANEDESDEGVGRVNATDVDETASEVPAVPGINAGGASQVEYTVDRITRHING